MAKVLRSVNMSRCIGCFACMLVCAAVNRRDHSTKKSCIKILTYGGMSGKFIDVVCNACREAACAEKCPTNALKPRKGGGVKMDKKLCMGCRRCKSSCLLDAVSFDEELLQPLICHHCGICAQYCPHDCLEVVEVEG